MQFSNFLLRVDGIRDASLDDFKQITEIGPRTYQPESQKYLYFISCQIVDDRFFWLSCEYDDAARFRNFVVNQETGNTEPNPRKKSQVELRQQFFACYDVQSKYLYLNDLNKRNFLRDYLHYSIQKEFSISNVYTSVEDFCNHIKAVRGFKFMQVDNIYARTGDIFNQVSNMWGLNAPKEIQLKITYGDVPSTVAKPLIDRFHKHKDEFENVIVIGCNDEGVEETFDFSSVLKHIKIDPKKDDNEQYDANEVRELLIAKLRRSDV